MGQAAQEEYLAVARGKLGKWTSDPDPSNMTPIFEKENMETMRKTEEEIGIFLQGRRPRAEC